MLTPVMIWHDTDNVKNRLPAPQAMTTEELLIIFRIIEGASMKSEGIYTKSGINLVLIVDFSFRSMYNLLYIGICGGLGVFVDSDALQTDYLVWKMIPTFASTCTV